MLPVGFEPTSSFEPSLVQGRLIQLGYRNMLIKIAQGTYFFFLVFILFGMHTPIQEEVLHSQLIEGLYAYVSDYF